MKPLSIARCAVGLLSASVAGCGGNPVVLSRGSGSAPTSAPEWSSQLGGDGFQAPLAVASTGDLAVMGGVYGSDFRVSDRVFSNAGGLDGVVAAFDPKGELRWARDLAGAEGDDLVLALASTPSGDILVGGQASPGARFGDYALGTDSFGAALLAKLDVEGEILWTVKGHGSGSHNVLTVIAAPDGGAYFAGVFSGELDLGTGAITSEGTTDAYLARCTADGEVQWVRALAGEGAQVVSRLAASANGDVTLIGEYESELVTETKTLARNPLSLTTPFVARYESDGTLVWTQSDLLPADINHVGQTHAHADHPALGLEGTTIAVGADGSATAVVAFGPSDHFGVTIGQNLTATRFNSKGRVVVQNTLAAPDAALVLGNAVAEDGGAEVAVSWTGTLPALGRFDALESDGTESLAVFAFHSKGTFAPLRIYSIPDVSLTSEDTARAADGSLLMAVSWRDEETLDRDIFLARFR